MGKRMDRDIPGGTHRQAMRRAAILALLADEALMDLMLRGGQTMDAHPPVQPLAHALAPPPEHQAGTLQDGQDPPQAQYRVEHALQSIFALQGYRAFDTRLSPLPGPAAQGAAPLPDGHRVEFTLLPRRQAERLQGDLRRMRREALLLGEGARLTIEISHRLAPWHRPGSGVIHVHVPLARVCEKLRAICQQMPAYRRFIVGASPGTPRAGDFVSIEALVRSPDLALETPAARQMLELAFFAQCVPLELLSGIQQTRSFHEAGFAQLRAALEPGAVLQDFGHYFDCVVDVVRKLRPPVLR